MLPQPCDTYPCLDVVPVSQPSQDIFWFNQFDTTSSPTQLIPQYCFEIQSETEIKSSIQRSFDEIEMGSKYKSIDEFIFDPERQRIESD